MLDTSSWCSLLRVSPLPQPGHVQLAGAQRLLDNEPGKLTRASPFGDWVCVEGIWKRFSSLRGTVKPGCFDYYHESRRLPPCQQLQSGQLEAEPEGYLSVFRVERFSRNQKTQGNKWTERETTVETGLERTTDRMCVCVCVCVSCGGVRGQFPALLQQQTSDAARARTHTHRERKTTVGSHPHTTCSLSNFASVPGLKLSPDSHFNTWRTRRICKNSPKWSKLPAWFFFLPAETFAYFRSRDRIID